MSLVSMFKGKGPSGFGYGSTAEEVSAGLDLSGRAYLVTGANSGIGEETARVLALRGATVLCAARDQAKADAAAAKLGGASRGVACELSEPSSVRAAVAAVRDAAPLAGIVANAGIMALPERQLRHGLELQFFTNHVGHFVLVTGLLDRLDADGRVVVLSSAAHRQAPPGGIDFDNLDSSKSYAPWTAYGRSKLANLLFARALARRLPPGQTANAVHPGVIATNLTRHMPGAMRAVWAAAEPLFLKSIPQGAATQTWAAVHPGAAALRGEYLADVNVATSTAEGQDLGLAERLWVETERIVAGLAG